jgi:hypothetical protein
MKLLVLKDSILDINIQQIRLNKKSVEITWSDAKISEAPFTWLRDNDPQELEPQTGESTVTFLR